MGSACTNQRCEQTAQRQAAGDSKRRGDAGQVTRSDFWCKATRKHQALAGGVMPRARSPAFARRL